MPRPRDSSDSLAPDGQGDQHTTPFIAIYQLEQNLQLYTECNLRNLPRNRGGLYAVWVPSGSGSAPECLYVGESKNNVVGRLRAHLTGADNDELREELSQFRDHVRFSTAFLDVEDDLLLQLERAAINRLQPRTNIKGRA